MYLYTTEGLDPVPTTLQPRFAEPNNAMLPVGRGFGYFSETGNPPFGSMDFGVKENDARRFARQQQQKYENVVIHNIVTGPLSTWKVLYNNPLPTPRTSDRMMFDQPNKAEDRAKILLAYGLETEVVLERIQGQRKYRVKAIKYLGEKSSSSLPMELGWDGFQWENEANAQRRAKGLSMLGYSAKVGQRGGLFQVNITSLPKLEIRIIERSRWHLIIKNTIACPPVKMLIDGEKIFGEMVRAISTATGEGHYIYVLGWMLQTEFRLVPRDPNSTLRILLNEAAKRGVQVRVMVWNNPLYIDDNKIAEQAIHHLPKSVFILDKITYGSPALASIIRSVQAAMDKVESIVQGADALIQKSVQAGAQVLRYGVRIAMPSTGILPPIAPPPSVGISMPEFWQKAVKYVKNAPGNEGSHHEKVLIVKGNDGLIGFCGGADINKNRLGGKHEVQCQVLGHAAWELLQRFITRWKVHPGTSGYGQLLGEREPEPPPHASEPTDYVKVIHTYNHWNHTAQLRNRSILETIRAAITHAERSIFMEDQYMVSLEVAKLLNQKLRAPQFKKLTIIIQSDCDSDDISFPMKKRDEFIRILMAGVSPDKVEIKMILPKRGQPSGREKTLHSKVIVIDDELAIIGSACCNRRSLTHDSETSVVIIGPVAKSIRARLEDHHQGNLVRYSPEHVCEDLDEKVMKSTVFQAALAVPNIGSVIRSLLPTIWNGLWEITDPQGPV